MRKPQFISRFFVLALGFHVLLSGCSSDTPTKRTSFLLPMRDGARIAITVWVPEHATREPVPTVLRMTRYWREYEFSPLVALFNADPTIGGRAYLNAGYAWVAVDARGTGASFGTSRGPWAPEEIDDYGEVIDWIIKQPWSNRRVGAVGVSYEANTSLMITGLNHPALKAVAPLYSYYDPATSVVRPGGVLCDAFLNNWSSADAALDRNDHYAVCRLSSSAEQCAQEATVALGVQRVDADSNGLLLAAAVREHQQNPNIFATCKAAIFADDDFGALHPADSRPVSMTSKLSQGRTPWFGRAGWLDSSSTRGALQAYRDLPSVPMELTIGSWSHGGAHDVDPFRPADAAPFPSIEKQDAEVLAFFDAHLKRDEPLTRRIRYSTFGQDGFRETAVWPPNGIIDETWFFGPKGVLSPRKTGDGVDTYAVEFSSTTGKLSRWNTPFQGPDVSYQDRRFEDLKSLTYTSEPFSSDRRITGTPHVELTLSTTHSDGAVFLYLEDVAPDGQVTYLTEGERRLIHPYSTLLRKDVRQVVPGQELKFSIDLEPLSALIVKGHRLRLAIAGHDAESFERLPAEGAPTLNIFRGSTQSLLVLPVES